MEFGGGDPTPFKKIFGVGVPLKIHTRPKGLVWIGGIQCCFFLTFGVGFLLKSVPDSKGPGMDWEGGTPTMFSFSDQIRVQN